MYLVKKENSFLFFLFWLRISEIKLTHHIKPLLFLPHLQPLKWFSPKFLRWCPHRGKPGARCAGNACRGAAWCGLPRPAQAEGRVHFGGQSSTSCQSLTGTQRAFVWDGYPAQRIRGWAAPRASKWGKPGVGWRGVRGGGGPLWSVEVQVG